ncbi:hypothetical protein KFK14_06510 [Sphingobium phenoxybenzoativorans]|uniref:Secreted protein n=1 Tax=Sphingobium phenoxybenzoativorans TaxID=1592790 RepID=A0A975K967_9SPHN|nr:hypothetical protein [Sphingobium phenoxybenzoativorans]QUT07070.1 hypothetical protein KFK14_06510 [Sphingobium phenoxybenzoativorans]
MARISALALASMIVLAPVSLHAADEPAKADPASDKAKSDRVICKTTEELGTRLKRNRVCKTAAEWNTERQENRAMLQRMQTNKSCGVDGC